MRTVLVEQCRPEYALANYATSPAINRTSLFLPLGLFALCFISSVVRYLGKYRDTNRDDTSIADVTVYRIMELSYQGTFVSGNESSAFY